MNQAGIDLIKEFESCHLKAYPDPKTGGAPWTCGWGDTEGVTPGTVWTQTYADWRLANRLPPREARIRAAVKVPLNENQISALVCIVDNVGEGIPDRPGKPGRSGILRLRDGQPSTLIRKLNAGDYKGAADEFMKWVSPGSNVEKGLRRRRTKERELFLRPVSNV